MPPVNVREFEAIARERMTPAAFDYYCGGAGDEQTLSENERAFADVTVWPRVLVDVSRVDPATTVLGTAVSSPVLVAPTAFAKLAHPDGEAGIARAAAAAGTIMTVSTLASATMEEIAAAADGPRWYQLYIYKDRGVTEELVARAEASGYRAIVLTVDTPVLGHRERDSRNGFTLPDGVSVRNLETCSTVIDGAARWAEGSSFTAYIHSLFDASLTWSTVEWLRETTRLPVIIKGVLRADDAELAVMAGASAIIVSNHGGRQLDGAPATVRALPPIVEAVDGRAEVYLDGGIRRGVDVLKALALGAGAVLVGRPCLWGLAADGEAGVARVLAMLKAELELAMALAGVPSAAAISPSLVTADGR
jgi:isopentenyl diphosphate isomerase/L-lactate dehydrogenase-like FMN-dependent dehydrogenase